jgi:ComF family protein
MHLLSGAKHLGATLVDLAIPHLCAGCGSAVGPGAADLCAACAWGLEAVIGGPYCLHCGESRGAHLLIDGQCSLCRAGRHARWFDRFIRVGRYAGTLERLVLQFKKRFVLDRTLGRLLADAIVGGIDPREVDGWVPIPAHWWRRLTVGFQPTDLLARAAVRGWLGVVEPALRMTRYLRPFHQSGPMSASARANAIRGAFSITDPAAVAGRSICLIDDVTTTGATLSEARRVLRAAGAKRVFAAVVAKVSRQ